MVSANVIGDVAHIDLLSAPAGTPVPALAGVTLDDLRRGYASIFSAGGIHYPVSFRFVRELGRGRQGAVMLAMRQGARGCLTEHAIKVYDPALYRSSEEYWTDMGRIAVQVSGLHSLQSPNLVTRSAYDETHGIGYVQMEAVDGADIQRLMWREHLEAARRRSSVAEWSHFMKTVFRMRSGRLCFQPGIVVYVMRCVLRGLERLHAAGFLHYDLKPGNIMVDRLGSVKLVDFGRAVHIGEKLTFLLGSPPYMAPEVHRREPGDQRSDLYSLGLVGIEMLRGRTLDEHPVRTEEEWLAWKMELPDRLAEWLPRDVTSNEVLFTILRKLVAPEPAERFPSATHAEIGEDGLLIVDKQLVQAGLDSEFERELSTYLSKLVDPRSRRVEWPPGPPEPG